MAETPTPESLPLNRDALDKAKRSLERQRSEDMFTREQKEQLRALGVSVEKNSVIDDADLQKIALLQTIVPHKAKTPDGILGRKTFERMKNLENTWKQMLSPLMSEYRSIPLIDAVEIQACFTDAKRNIPAGISQAAQRLIERKRDGADLAVFSGSLTEFYVKHKDILAQPIVVTGNSKRASQSLS